MTALPNLISIFNEIPIKISLNYFVDTDKLILKFTRKCEKAQHSQFGSEGEEQNEGLTLPDLKTYYKTTVIKTYSGAGKRTDV